MQKQTKRKIFVLLMVICMLTTYMPTIAFAQESAADAQQTEDQTEVILDDQENDASVDAEDTEEQTNQEEVTTDNEETAEDSEPAAEDKESSAEEPVVEEPLIEETETTEKTFNADKADYLSYDPLFILRYADSRYINVDEINMSAFYDVVTAARGVASYTFKKESDFNKDQGNYLATLNYETPVYDVDKDSKYYVAIPNVNLFNSNFKPYDLTVAYNNDHGDIISGWKYSNYILYIPKKAIDKPTTKYADEADPGTQIAIQLYYAIGNDLDFSKDIPAQILSSDEPVDKTVHTSNLFDVDLLSVDTGVKHRSKSEIGVYLNGNLITRAGTNGRTVAWTAQTVAPNALPRKSR